MNRKSIANPVNWKMLKLQDVAEIESGGNAPQESEYFENGYLPFIRVKHFDGEAEYVEDWDLINQKAVDDYNLNLYPKESIIFPKSGASINLEKKAIVPIESFIVNHLCIVIPKKNVNNKYLFYLIKNKKLSSFAVGTALPYLNLSVISKLKVLIPPLNEQNKIESILSSVNIAFYKTKNILQKLRKLKRGLLQQLLTKGIGHTEFKETKLGRIPKEWEIREIRDFTETKYGTSNSLNENGQGFPVIKMDNITYDGKLLLNKISFTNISRKEFLEQKLKKGDLLFNRTNSLELVGKVALFDEDNDYVPVSYIIRIRIKNKELDPIYLNYYLNSPKMKVYMRRLAKPSVSQANINAEQLKSIKIPIPPLSEQRKINGIISGIDANVEINNALKMNLVKLKRGLMQQLLTGKIRVKVNGS